MLRPINSRFTEPTTKLSTKIRTSSFHSAATMSYYFAIIGTQDNPLFEYEFGTAKQGGDGVARFPEQARHMNQFIVHSSLDIVEEVQWAGGQMYSFLSYGPFLKLTIFFTRYLKCIDRFYNNYVSCFITGGSKNSTDRF